MADLNKTGNPILRTKAFTQPGVISGDRMTVSGTIGKSIILLVLLILTAGWVWDQFHLAGIVLDFWYGVLVSALGFAIVSAAIGLTNLGVSLGATPVGGRREARLRSGRCIALVNHDQLCQTHAGSTRTVLANNRRA